MTLASIAETEPAPGVLRWSLCRPARRNPVDPAALDWITARCGSLSGQVVVLTGDGDEAFCAGFDLDALAALQAPIAAQALPDAPLIAAAHAMEAADATFIARLGGYAIGAGVELCCACDLRVARHGVSFQIPANRLGVVYHADGVARLLRTFGSALTRRLLLLGEKVGHDDARAAGAIDRLVPADELDAAVDDLVADLRGGQPASVAGHRALLRRLSTPELSTRDRKAHDARRLAAYRELGRRLATSTDQDDG